MSGFNSYDTSGRLKTVASGIAADSLTVTSGSAVAAYNLSTLGTVDWLATNGSTTIPRQLTNGNCHNKALGGLLMLGFDWIMVGPPTLFTQNITPTMTTTLGDDCASAPLSAAVGGQGAFTTAGAKYGYRLVVPAIAMARTLVLYAESFSCNSILTAILHGQVKTTKTVSITGTSNTARGDLFTINYQAPLGGHLDITYALDTALGVNLSPNVKFGFAYITE